ncbi:TetR/AcrR family transcriptional regulator [Hoyosella subflava]|uniref:TetR family transcriptional regulator n=1 Tax=Hoyosella subflava (strain DSM 45089 / JCM 17490 / NBRC 109087 / DQS3-9A1) TaxID=443218 RepID=F6EJ26_HOYSD|nr:TetR/AcrR family transcriptional regulator [Hoyosella subflava]AEF41258.1 TetR family transcriptional regulator [Hoyosella subflava DQS3-9A1]
MTDPVAVVRQFRGVSAADRVRQRRDALLDAGLKALAEGNLASITVDDISARAGLSKRYFYEHFRTRNDLFVTLVERLIEQLTAAVTAPSKAPDLGTYGRLQEAVMGVVSVLIDNPGNTRLFVDTIGGDQLRDTVRRTEHAIAALVIDVTIGDTQVTERERTRLDMAALILVAGAAQAVSDWLDGDIDLSRTELIEEFVRVGAAAFHTILPDL